MTDYIAVGIGLLKVVTWTSPPLVSKYDISISDRLWTVSRMFSGLIAGLIWLHMIYQ